MGKGSRSRVRNARAYARNFDTIDWRSKTVIDAEKTFKRLMKEERSKKR